MHHTMPIFNVHTTDQNSVYTSSSTSCNTNIQCAYHTTPKFNAHHKFYTMQRQYLTHISCSNFPHTPQVLHHTTPIFSAQKYFLILSDFPFSIPWPSQPSWKFLTRLSNPNSVAWKSKWLLHNNDSKCNFNLILLRNLGVSLEFFLLRFFQFDITQTLRWWIYQFHVDIWPIQVWCWTKSSDTNM